METLDFIKLVAEMRISQIEYFKYRTATRLQEAKRLEKKVDEEVKRLLNNNVEPPPPTQQFLFE